MTDPASPNCKCGHPRYRHALLAGVYAQCRQRCRENARGKCSCGLYRPLVESDATEAAS